MQLADAEVREAALSQLDAKRLLQTDRELDSEQRVERRADVDFAQEKSAHLAEEVDGEG